MLSLISGAEFISIIPIVIPGGAIIVIPVAVAVAITVSVGCSPSIIITTTTPIAIAADYIGVTTVPRLLLLLLLGSPPKRGPKLQLFLAPPRSEIPALQGAVS